MRSRGSEKREADRSLNPLITLTVLPHILITKWSFPFDDEREFNVNIWDFGEQEIYHATHQFFLTKRSLYALVVDTRREDTDFYYWLNVVELLSNNSPLLIIKNEKDDREKQINERALRGQFKNLQETLATNLKTNRGLENICKSIQYYIQSLPFVGQELPKTWVQVRKSLENDPRNPIPGKKNEELIAQQGGNSLENCNERISGLPTRSSWRIASLSIWLILGLIKKAIFPL